MIFIWSVSLLSHYSRLVAGAASVCCRVNSIQHLCQKGQYSRTFYCRFNVLELFVSWSDEFDEKAWDKQAIETKCQLFEEQLKLIKPVLDDSDLHIHVQVDENT